MIVVGVLYLSECLVVGMVVLVVYVALGWLGIGGNVGKVVVVVFVMAVLRVAAPPPPSLPHHHHQ